MDIFEILVEGTWDSDFVFLVFVCGCFWDFVEVTLNSGYLFDFFFFEKRVLESCHVYE